MESLETLYAGLSSVSLKAGVGIERRDGQRVYGHGEFEYVAAADGRYRLRYEIDPRLGLLGNAEIAFDGSQYEYFLAESGTLTLEAEEPPVLPIALPNPFLVPLRFLAATPYSDIAQAPRLELASDPERWNRWHRNRRPTERRSEALVASPSHDAGAGRFHRLTVSEDGRIDRIAEEDGLGHVVTELRLSHYHDYGDHAFPHTMALTQFHPESGEVLQIVRYEITALEFDAPLSDELFRVDRSKVTSLWDGESKSFVEKDESMRE